MSKILVIGNVLKDVYLKLDERHNNFETDEHGIDWLDLCFNGKSYPFFQRTSVYGGVAVTLGVLSRLGISSQIMGSDTEFKNNEIIWQDTPADYRYILCHEGKITYFVPSQRKVTDWVMPKDNPEWILIDRSTLVSERLVEELKNFRKLSPATKIAVHTGKDHALISDELVKMADVLFVEDEAPVHSEEKVVDKVGLPKAEKLTCYISKDKIAFGDAVESWELSRTDMLTHLTVYNTIVATILGVIAAGGSMEDAVLWAKINAEQSNLESSLSGRKIKELAEAERAKRAETVMIAKSIMTPGKGILAADENDHTLTERLVGFGINANAETRRNYRRLLLTTPELKDYASAVILTEEVARSKVSGGSQSYLDYLTSRGIITGVKADQGQISLDGTEGETYTLGIKDLAKRLRGYYNDGFRFAKWHAEFQIGQDKPSFIALERAAEELATFAKECQLAGLVPMIETDVSGAGDHSLEKDVEVTDRVLLTIFEKLERNRVELGSVILKTNMVMAGSEVVAPSTPHEVGIATAAVIKHAVPYQVAGVVFLSAGQKADNATKNLAEIVKVGGFDWPVSFAFSRALQDPVMQIWKGKDTNKDAAQASLRRHLQDNSAVIRG